MEVTDQTDQTHRRALARSAASILWPAFLAAGVLEALVFALVDPHTLQWPSGAPLDLPAVAVHSAAFFAFWAVVAAAGLLMRLLQGRPEHINAEGASGAFRH
jgi:hypothetical protein